MHVAHLTLHDFRSYGDIDVALEPGATAFIGRNGQGKTNLVEAIDYLSRLSSHRVATDAPLVRAGADQAIVRASVVKEGRTALLEVELNPGRANRARINRSPLPRPREIIGLVRTVVFAPDDLTLVKGDPSDRRKFLDDLLMLRTPRLAGVRSDYDRILKQRNSLLKTAGLARGSSRDAAMATLEIWDDNLARVGAEILDARLRLVEDLRPYLGKAYEAVARGASRDDADLEYKASVELNPPLVEQGEERARVETKAVGGPGFDTVAAQPAQPAAPLVEQGEERARVETKAPLQTALLDAIRTRRKEELDRGISLVGPHRDELLLTLGDPQLRLPVKGYASHGESWSFALALRLASYDLLRADGDDPILVLDDVFAELDTERRDQLAQLVAGAEQVLVTAAVAADVPASLQGVRFLVADGTVTRDG